ncbi:MAG: haloalkane dehalogenase [Proteobacteria bacterium]|nr:haloalkane dehalogenase [Pseudomonadota bacterium]MDA1356754.1 haloalkane dehalogenase [Pseudomonadota bacterium]
MISSDERYTKKFAEVNGARMAYLEVGTGDPIIFLHGNPTSSYLWRNVMPHAEALGRCIAPDLIGMGDSDKLANSGPESYRLAEHQTYLDGLLDVLGVSHNVIMVVHDWGGPLGFDWLRRHAEAAKGVAYMETIVTPMKWDAWPEQARQLFQAFRSPAGDNMVLEKNIFVERVLPGSIIRDLNEAEMAVYRRPFIEPGESRRPTLTWPRQIPIDGEPAEVVDIVRANDAFLKASDMPKLFVNAEPGAILQGPLADHCRAWPNTSEVTVAGNHFIQEDSPDEIGVALAEWIRGL